MKIVTYITHSIVDAWNFREVHAEILRRRIPGVNVQICGTEQEFTEGLRGADVVLTWTFRQEWFALAPRLKVISTPAAGKDYFHVVPPAGVTMLNGHFHGEIIAETVVAMILAMIRGLLRNATQFADLPWAREELSPSLRTLRGSNVTILGFGHIGRWIGRLIKPFGTTSIWGMTRHGNASFPDWFTENDRIFTASELDVRLCETDHLVLALPSTTGTDGIVGEHELALLPKGATVTNVGRGNALNEAALIKSLRDGHLGGAVLDVFAEEPLDEHSPLMSCPNLWRLPHASAIAPNYLSLYSEEVSKDLVAVLG